MCVCVCARVRACMRACYINGIISMYLISDVHDDFMLSHYPQLSTMKIMPPQLSYMPICLAGK